MVDWRRPGVHVADDVPLDVFERQSDEDNGEHTGENSDDRLHPHDQVEAHHAAAGDERGHDQHGDNLGRVAAIPPQPSKDR